MRTKLYYLLLPCLMVLGRGEVWADNTYVFKWSRINNTVRSGNDYTATFFTDDTKTVLMTPTITYTRSETSDKFLSNGELDCIKFSNGYTYYISNLPQNEVVVSIQFVGYSNSASNSSTIYINNVEQSNATFPAKSNPITLSTFTIGNLNLTESFSFKAVGHETAMQITVNTQKQSPVLAFPDATGFLKIGDGESSARYTKQVSTNTSDGTLTYSITDGQGNAVNSSTEASINSSTGEVTAFAAGTYMVKASVAETSNYKAAETEYTLTVTKVTGTYSMPNTETKTYPYTWDFTVGSTAWSTSQTQLTTTYGDWGGSGTYYHHTTPPNGTYTYPSGFAIDVVKGLRFSDNWLGLDWGYGHIWFALGDIVIPGLSNGQTVSFVMEGRGSSATTITAANTSVNANNNTIANSGYATYTYSVTAGGDITFHFDNPVSIRSIAVSAKIAPDLSGQIGIHGTKHYSSKNVAVGTNFSWDGQQNTDQRLRLQLTNLRISASEALPDEFKSNTYFTVTSSNPSVINVNNYNVYSAPNQSGGDGRAYCDVTVAGVGETTLTITYHGANGDFSTQQTFNISRIPICYNSTYPFTWDFENYDWVGSEVQLLKNTDYWTYTSGNSYVDIKGATLVTWSGIDMISGLEGSSVNDSPENGFIRLSWGNEKYMQVNGDITVPNLTEDNIVTIKAETGATIQVGGQSLTESPTGFYVYNSTGNGSVTFNVNDKKIYSIAVTETPKANVTFDYVEANGKLLNQIDKPVKGDEVTHIYGGPNSIVRLTAACASDSYNTVEFVKGSSSKDHVKWQGGSYLAVSSDKAIIRKVVFTLKGTESNLSYITIDGGSPGSLTTNSSAKTATWTSGASDVSFVKFKATNNVDQLASVYVEYVERTPVTRFSPMGHQTTTFPYATGNPVAEQTIIIDPNTATLSASTSDFEVAFTSNRDVIAITTGQAPTIDNSNKERVHFNTGVTRGLPGTADVYYRYKGNSTNSGAMAVVTFTITKADQTLSFANNAQTQSYSENGTFNYPANHSVGDGAVTYKSSDENVATVDNQGVVKFKNSGVTTITATAAETSYYNAATASYTLTVQGSENYSGTITWDTSTGFEIPTEIAYGNDDYVLATTTVEGETVQYRSSDPTVAKVETLPSYNGKSNVCKITPVSKGTVTIIAYIAGSGNTNPLERPTTTSINIGGDKVKSDFYHGSGIVTKGKTLTPYVKVPNAKVADFSSITVTTADENIAKVGAGETGSFGSSVTLTTANGGLKEEGGDLKAIFPTIYGVEVGGPIDITMTFTSDKYENTTVTYKVEVVSKDLNFAWAAPANSNNGAVTEYTIYTGDYMMMPAISGNANGNWDYSKGETCEAKQSYLYGMRAGSPIWNYADFKVGEGYPNYRLTDSNDVLTSDEKNSMTNDTEKAYIIWASSQNTSDDTLMIYGRQAGEVWLHAFDAQTKAELETRIHITILDKNTLANAVDGYVQDMSYPYTWDFTKDFTVSASPNYWEPHYNSSGTLDYYICGYSTMFNWDYCDQDNDGSMNEALGNVEAKSPYNKYFVASNEDEGMNNVMPQFYGMTIYSGNSGDTRTKSYETKRDKLRITPSAGEGNPHLQVVGGIHYLRLPSPKDASILPADQTFKLIVKAKPTSGKTSSTMYKYKDGNHSHNWGNPECTAVYIPFNGLSFVTFDVNKSEITGDHYIELGVDNVEIYWIAMTTEAKTINPASGATGDNIEMMATYSYDKAIDYAKSSEANGIDAYVASELNWNNTDNTLQVTLKKNNTEVPKRTGVVLRTKNRASSKSFSFSDISNDKTDNNQSGTDYRSAFSMDNDTIHVEANKNGWVKIEECSPSVTVGDHTYEKCLNLLGRSSDGYRYVRVAVTGPAVISVDCKADANASLEFYEGSYSGPNQGGTSVSVGTSATTVTYTHSGEKTYIYFCSATDTPIRIYGITRTNKGASAYMIADAQNEANYTAPSKPSANYLLSTWASDAAQPTLYRNAGNETGTVSGDTYLPFIFSSKYNRTATGNQDHDAGYFSFWRIWVNSITAGKNMAYIVLKKDDYVNAAKANGKAGDVTNWMLSGEGSRMTLRFIDNDEEDIQTTVESVVSEGVSDDISPEGDGYYYDLRGVRVEHPTKGLYIRNGRKVWVK